MKLGLHIGVPGKKLGEKALAAAAEAAEAWRAGKKEEAVAILNDIFAADVPSAEQLAPYAEEFGAEYRDLVSKLYLLHFDPEDDEWEWSLAEFEEACGGGLVTGFASRLAGAKWEEVREKFKKGGKNHECLDVDWNRCYRFYLSLCGLSFDLSFA